MTDRARLKPNNPRAFVETISLDSWRSSFDPETGEARLYVDAVFADGRVGGPNEPIRFRLSLKKAEIHIILDAARVLRIVPSSVLRSPLLSGILKKTINKRKGGRGNLNIELSPSHVKGAVGVNADSSVEYAEHYEQSSHVSQMNISHRRVDNGYIFIIEPREGLAFLDGQPWDVDIVALKVRDTRFSKSRPESPEPRLEIQCRREDLSVSDIEFTNRKKFSWASLSKEKRLAVERYLKDEISRFGFYCEDLSDPYARLVLCDSIPFEERNV